MGSEATRAISFRIGADRLEQLERLAEATDRPRSWHIEQALAAYLDLQAWQVAQIEQSIAELDAGLGIPHEEVKREMARWRRKRKARQAG